MGTVCDILGPHPPLAYQTASCSGCLPFPVAAKRALEVPSATLAVRWLSHVAQYQSDSRSGLISSRCCEPYTVKQHRSGAQIG